jgi:hypothetical protein
MNIGKDKFLASLLAFGLAGAAGGCGSSAEETETADTDMTTGGDTMAEPTDPGMDDPGMGDPGMDDPGMDDGSDMGTEPEGDLGPAPE